MCFEGTTDSNWTPIKMAHGTAYVIWLGSLLLFTGALMFSVSIGLDTFVEVTYTPVANGSDVTDKFGVFSWDVNHDVGLYANSSGHRYAVDCVNTNARISPTEKTDKPTATCAAQCQSKKSFAVLGAAFGFLAVMVLLDTREGNWWHLWIHREAFGYRVTSAVFGTFAFFSGVIVMSLFHQQMATQTYLVGAATTSQEYSEKMGVCAYKIGKTDSLAVASYKDPVYGDAYWIMLASTVMYGIGTLAIAVTFKEDSAEE